MRQMVLASCVDFVSFVAFVMDGISCGTFLTHQPRRPGLALQACLPCLAIPTYPTYLTYLTYLTCLSARHSLVPSIAAFNLSSVLSDATNRSVGKLRYDTISR